MFFNIPIARRLRAPFHFIHTHQHANQNRIKFVICIQTRKTFNSFIDMISICSCLWLALQKNYFGILWITNIDRRHRINCLIIMWIGPRIGAVRLDSTVSQRHRNSVIRWKEQAKVCRCYVININSINIIYMFVPGSSVFRDAGRQLDACWVMRRAMLDAWWTQTVSRDIQKFDLIYFCIFANWFSLLS